MNKFDKLSVLLRLLRNINSPIVFIRGVFEGSRFRAMESAPFSESASPVSVEARAHALKAAIEMRELMAERFMAFFTNAAEKEWSPENGARVVAKAWVDPGYRAELLRDGTSACAKLGYEGPQGEHIVALENTDLVHNVIVCTLCSCTAWPVIGLPPEWYKSFEYRARVVRESRTVLREMGFDPPDGVEIRVWDTTAETRYMVLPLRPKETHGWTEKQLSRVVSREALIGVAPIRLT